MSTLLHPTLRAAGIAEIENEWAGTPLLSSLLRDLYDWLGTAWAMAMQSSDGELRTVFTCGTPPNRRACLEYIRSLARRKNFAHQDWQLHVLPPEAHDRLPRLVASSSTDRGTFALAFGPKTKPGEYSVSDCTLILDAVAQISALMCSERLARCVAASMREHQDLRVDLDAAREVQRRSLPTRLPRIKGLDYYGESLPARELGGDFFDFVAVGDNSLAVSVGDVSGHGIGSALLMSGIQAYARGLTTEKHADAKLVVSELNRISYEISPDNFFATMFYAHIDPVLNRMQYVSAGHGPALLIRRDRTVEELESTGTVLGLSGQSVYVPKTLRVNPGDTLVIATDGVSEREYEDGRSFATAVVTALGYDEYSRACEIVDAILDSSSGWSVQDDDRTVVVVRFTESAERQLLCHSSAKQSCESAGQAA